MHHNHKPGGRACSLTMCGGNAPAIVDPAGIPVAAPEAARLPWVLATFPVEPLAANASGTASHCVAPPTHGVGR